MTAIDVFADEDTRQACQQVYKLAYDQGGFVVREFEQLLQTLALDNFYGAVYGSGFESQPLLLELLQKHAKLIGNTPEVVQKIKQPAYFFALLDELNVAHPAVSFSPLPDASGWLQKHAGGSGGTHVVWADARAELAPDYYYQQVMPGEPVSMLFIADGERIQPIGFNRQWVAPTESQPFRYGGIVGHADLPQAVQQQFIHAATRLTHAVGLRGLNSIDGVMHENAVSILEVNPRLSSTFDLYQPANGALFDLHVRACQGDMPEIPHWPRRSKARRVMYASQDCCFAQDFVWPDWVADIPVVDSAIKQNNPICTILADADNAQAAKDLVNSRAAVLAQMIDNYKRIEQ